MVYNYLNTRTVSLVSSQLTEIVAKLKTSKELIRVPLVTINKFNFLKLHLRVLKVFEMIFRKLLRVGIYKSNSLLFGDYLQLSCN